MTDAPTVDEPTLDDTRLRAPRIRDDGTIHPDAVPETELDAKRDYDTRLSVLIENSKGLLRRKLDALYGGAAADLPGGFTDEDLANLFSDPSSRFVETLDSRYAPKTAAVPDSSVAMLVNDRASATRRAIATMISGGSTPGVPGTPGIPAPYVPSGALAAFRTALMNSKTGICTIAVVGDSMLEGTKQTSLATRVIGVLADRLRAHLGHGTDQGYEYYPAFYEFERLGDPPLGQGISWNTPLTQTRISTRYGLGRRGRKMLAGDKATLKRKFTDLDIDVYFPTATGSVDITIAGGTPIRWSPGKAGFQKFDMQPYTGNLERTVTVETVGTPVTDQEPVLLGIHVFENTTYSGIRIVDGSKHGTMAWQFNTARDSNGGGHWDAVFATNPKLLVLGHITNDFKFAKETAASWKLSQQKNIDVARVRDKDIGIAIFIPWQVAGSPGTAGETWKAWVAAANELAAENQNVEVWDMSAVVTDKTGLTATNDAIHWNDKGAGVAVDFLFGKITENGKLGGTVDESNPGTTPNPGTGGGNANVLTVDDFGFNHTAGADNTVAVNAFLRATMDKDAPEGVLPAADIYVKYLEIDYSTFALQPEQGRPYGYAGPNIRGAGTGKTVFKRLAGHDGPFLTIKGHTGLDAGPANNNKVRGMILRDLTLDLQGVGNGAWPAVWIQSVLNSSFTDVWVIDAPGDGFYFAREIYGYNTATVDDEYNHGNYFVGCKVLIAKGVGFADSGSTSIGRTMIGCEAQSVAGGFWLNPTSTSMIGCRVFGSIGPALRARRNKNTVSSNTGLRVMGFRAEQTSGPGLPAVSIDSGLGYELAGVEYYSTQGEDCLWLGMNGDGSNSQNILRAARVTGGVYGLDRNRFPTAMAIKVGPDSREATIEVGAIQFSGGFVRVQDYMEDKGLRTSWLIAQNQTVNLDGSVTVLIPLNAHPAAPPAGAVKEYVLLETVAGQTDKKLARYHRFATGDPVREWIQP